MKSFVFRSNCCPLSGI